VFVRMAPAQEALPKKYPAGHSSGKGFVHRMVRPNQLPLAIGRSGQNVRLASKLVGWDIELMTAEELDEVIEKAVKAFEKIEVVDTELAERLVEQGILSYDDLSVMEISDLVNTIEGLTEEQAVEVVAKAEVLAEAQTEELPRRKGARASASEPAPVIETLLEGESETETETESETDTDVSADGSPTADEFIQTDSESGIDDAATLESSSALPSERVNEVAGEFLTDDSTDSERDEASDDEIHDLALAEEKSNYSPHGHEVSSPPSDEDQGESIRIVTEAVEQSGPEAAAAAPSATNREPAVSPRHSTPPTSASLSNQHSDGARRPADGES
jgi:transcription termination/antitermination protein NusA